MRVEVPRPEKLRLSSETGVARSLSFERRSPTPLWLAGAALRAGGNGGSMQVGVPRRRSSGSAPPSSLPADRSYTGVVRKIGSSVRFRYDLPIMSSVPLPCPP